MPLASTALLPQFLIRQFLSHPDNRSSSPGAQGQFLQDPFLDLGQASLGFFHGLDQYDGIEGKPAAFLQLFHALLQGPFGLGELAHQEASRGERLFRFH